MTLVRLVATGPLDSPVVVTAMDGWVDSGSAATMAAALLSEDGDTLATFDSDRIYDFRARRPTLEIIDGMPRHLTWPELKLVRRRLDDRDILVLSGPEPDYRWQQLGAELAQLARMLEVQEWISLGAIPAAVPHTRPVTVFGTASRDGLLRAQVEAGPIGTMTVPAAAISILDMALAGAGVPAVGYFAQVPHYVSGEYPAAALELLSILEQHLGITIPHGSLEEEARALRSRLDAAAAADGQTRAYVERLEGMVDEARLPSGTELISDIERFLRDRGAETDTRG
jgi:proteasome assembly chaperone (PAC2) family protein